MRRQQPDIRPCDLAVGNMEICIITPDGIVAPFLAIPNQTSSEITGPAFNPAGNRLYFSSQRGTSGDNLGTGGITYEVTGPFAALDSLSR